MKKLIAPIALTALLLTGCGGGTPDAGASSIEAHIPVESSEHAEPEDTEVEKAQTKEESEAQLKEALTQPNPQPVIPGNPKTQYLDLYKQELQTLAGGPYDQLGTDEETIQLGEQACSDLEVMSYGEALLVYAFDENTTEAQVADYNAALNAAASTLCP